MQESFELRNKAMEFTLFCETSASMSKTLRDLRSERRKTFSKFSKHCGDKHVAKARHKQLKDKMAEGDYELSVSDVSLSDVEDS